MKMTNEEIKSIIKHNELSGGKLEHIQLGNDVYLYLDEKLILECEVI